jgi:hypothetical protein
MAINVGIEAKTTSAASSAIDFNADAGVEAAGAVVSDGLDGKRCRRSAFYRRVTSK